MDEIKPSSIAASTPRSGIAITNPGNLIVNKINMTSVANYFWLDRLTWWTKQLKADPNLNIDYTKVVAYEQSLCGYITAVLCDRIVSLGKDNIGMPYFTNPAITGVDDTTHAKATSQSKQAYGKINGIDMDANLWQLVVNQIRPVKSDPYGSCFLTLYIETTGNWSQYLTNVLFTSTYKDEYARALANIKLTLHRIETKECDMMLDESFCIVDDDAFVSKLLTSISIGMTTDYFWFSAQAFSLYTEDIDRAIFYWFNKITSVQSSPPHQPLQLFRPENGGVSTNNVTNVIPTARSSSTVPSNYTIGSGANEDAILHAIYVYDLNTLIFNNIYLWQYLFYPCSNSALDPTLVGDNTVFNLWLFDNGVKPLAFSKVAKSSEHFGDAKDNKKPYWKKKYDTKSKGTASTSSRTNQGNTNPKRSRNFDKGSNGKFPNKSKSQMSDNRSNNSRPQRSASKDEV